ncbi:MAG: aldo/keto reductase [Nitrososphaerota archaeon]|jgi:aryl-alcohol dehydrogenase-like predicted oxidoreductase|nr:aldo/keto reductase [Nitrososphaerota archaeon]
MLVEKVSFEGNMERMRLGRSGLSVPRISLGTNNFGGPQLNQEASNRIMAHAVELGIDMFDTADIYTGGESERIIGEFIKDNREDVIIATKAGKEGDVGRVAAPNKASVSRKNIMYRLEQSLKRLQTSYVDLYYVHKYDQDIPLEETMTTLDSLVKQGKIRYIACSNYTREQIVESKSVAQRLGLENFVAVQNKYNLISREMETDVIPYCAENGVGTLAFSPLASGFLAGRYEQGKPPPAGSRGSYRSLPWLEKYSKGTEFQKLDRLKEIAAKTGVEVSVLALSWILRDQQVTGAIVGASDPKQLDESAKAVDVKLSSEDLDILNSL